MKNLTFLLTLFLPFLIQAQNTEGEIHYAETVQMNFELPPEHAEQFKGKFPTSQTNTKVLYFNENSSLYKDLEAAGEPEENVAESDGLQIKMVMVRPSDELHKDLTTGIVTESRDFMGKKFLITTAEKGYNWKLTGQQKSILGYPCQQAALQDDERQVEAWFTPNIPMSNGPAQYGKLPGMILELNIDNGERTLVAQKVSLLPVTDKIEVPKKGKVVTEEEYDQIVEEKTKEMEQNMGGGGIRIRTRN